MSDLNWGMLAKSQADPETIEEAIARIVVQHNADEEAHLSAGQSLQSHKAAEIIDHLANSIIEDKILNRQITLEKLSDFERERYSLGLESLDAWDISAGVSLNLGEIYLETGSVINTVRNALTRAGALPHWNKNQDFQFIFRLDSITNQLFYISAGINFANEPEDQGVGFKVVNNTLSAYHKYSDGSDETEVLTTITGITLTNYNIYRIKFVPGEAIYFYINDVLKATHSSNLPSTDFEGGGVCDVYLKNTAAENKICYIRQIYFTQDL
jgi:hypothetical protein